MDIYNHEFEEDDKDVLPKLTSLYPYYATLPKFVRDDHNVKLAYRALEFTKHTMSIADKEKALNFICYSALEMDESN